MAVISPREILLGSTADRRVLVLAAEASNIAYADGTLRGPTGERVAPNFASGFVIIQTGFEAEVWNIVRPSTLGVPGDPTNTFFRSAGSSETFGSAEALILQSQANPKEFILAFRGTVPSEGDPFDWPDIDDYLAEFFQPLLASLSALMPSDARLIVTGHSLGAYAADALAETGAIYGTEYVNAIYVPFATPGAGSPANVLEIGFQNDNVFELLNLYTDQPAATDYFYWFDPNFDSPPLGQGFHGSAFYSEAAHRLATSAYAGLMTRDDVVVFVNGLSLATPFTAITAGSFSSRYNASGRAFVLGSDAGEAIFGGGLIDFIEGRAGTDILVGDLGNDLLDGGDGNDSMTGGGGNDTLYGGEGSDTAFFAGPEEDYNLVDLGGGRWRVSHSRGDATDGTDVLYGVETLVFGGVPKPLPTSTITTIIGTDFLVDANDPTKVIERGEDVLYGTELDDLIHGRSGSDVLSGGAGNDTLQAGEKSLFFTNGTVVLASYVFRDVLIGGAGDDRLAGGDVMDGGTGNDIISATRVADDIVVNGGEGNDVLQLEISNRPGVTLDLSSSSGVLTPSWLDPQQAPWDRIRYTSVEGFEISLAEGNDTIIGGTWKDKFYSEGGFDRIWGGGGDDLLSYGTGSDFFHGNVEFYGGDGDDHVSILSPLPSSNRNAGDDNDRLFGEAGNDMLISGIGDDMLDGGPGLDTLFGDVGNDTLYGGLGGDDIGGGAGDDLLYPDDPAQPGEGNDEVYGGTGFDTVDYSTSTVPLTIQKFGFGQAFWTTVVGASSVDWLYDVEKIIGPSLGANWIASAFSDIFGGGAGPDSVSYANASGGVTVNLSIAGPQATGGSGNDTFSGIEKLIGSNFGDTFTGDASANDLNGGGGDDALIGGAGPDLLNGGDGNDVIALFATSDGSGDVIDGGAGTDALQFGLVASNIAMNVSIAGYVNSGMLPGGGSYQGIEFFYLVGSTADDTFTGSNLTDYMYGGMGGDVLIGGRGNDFIYGLGFWPAGGSPFDGVDTLSGGEGDDTIYGYGGADIIDGGAGNDLLLGDDGTLNHVGANPQADIMFGRDGNDQMYGEDGNDQLDGGAGNDFQSGGIGDDTLLGGAGADTILDEAGATGAASINAGTGDDHITLSGAFLSGVVNGSVGTDQLTASGVLSGLTFQNIETLNTGGGVVTATAAQLRLFSTIQNSASNISGPITLILSTGGQLNLTNKAVGRDVHLTGSSTIDVLTGSTGNDVIDGGAGGDTLNGAGGNDTLTGGDGLDTLDGGIGDDVIHGGAGNDVITGGDGNDVITDTGGTVVSISGGLGDDVITLGTASSGTVNGGVGVDEVNASAFLRSIVFTGVETLNTGGLLVTATAAQMEVFDTIRVSAADTAGAVSLRLSEAGLINLAGELGTRAVTFTGSTGNDTITTGDGADTITGGTGNDTINGRQGNDLILQGSTDGRDIVDGGAGHDTWRLSGTAAAETFRIMTRAEALAAGMTGLGATTEIVITKDGTDNASIIAELDNIEEIEINALLATANNGNGTVDGGSAGGDTILVIGDFTTTSLDYSTIRIAGSSGDDTIDITGLTSAHRVVFAGNGGADTVIGTPRPQDVFEGISAADARTGMLAETALLDDVFAGDGLAAMIGGPARGEMFDLGLVLGGAIRGHGLRTGHGHIGQDDLMDLFGLFETDLGAGLGARAAGAALVAHMNEQIPLGLHGPQGPLQLAGFDHAAAPEHRFGLITGYDVLVA